MVKPSPLRKSAKGRSDEVAALLAGARALQEHHTFAGAAKAVLTACRTILRTGSGLVGWCAKDGKSVEVTVHDPGGLTLDPAAGFPADLRRLHGRALRRGRTLFANDLSKRKVRTVARGSDPALENALIAPIVTAGEVTGILCLINKPGGFSTADSRLAEVFAEMLAVAMLRSRTVNGLEKSRDALELEVQEGAAQLRQAEESFRTLVENLPDVIARFDPQLRHLYISPAIEQLTGHPPQHYLGRASRELGLPPAFIEPWEAALNRVFATGRPELIEREIPTAAGARQFDCRLIPEPGTAGTVASVLSIARDVTETWLAREAERRNRAIADELREATVALTRSLDRETVVVTLLERLRRIVPFDRASVMVVEESSRVSVRAIFDGERVVPLTPDVRPEFDLNDHPIIHGIWTSGTAVMIPDLRSRPDWSLPADPSSEASWIGVPLFARGDVAGLFSLSNSKPGYFNDEHLRLAEAMSYQASVAVENAVLFEQMQAATLRMQALSRRLIEVQEGERRHIARELHDEAGQALTSLRYGLRLLLREIDRGGNVTEQVTDLVQRTDAVIESLHRLAADLRPASLDELGLDAALRQYSRSAGSKFGLAVRFKARGLTGERLPMVVETALYRVVQEALTNVARHAQATRVDVLVEHRGDRVTVVVEDNGGGFEPGSIQLGERLGLLGLRERAEALGGSLTLESAPGRGTTVVVEVSSADPHPDR